MINYRFGGCATGKTFRLLRQLSGKEYVVIYPFKYKAKNMTRFFEENKKHHYGDTSKAKVTTIADYMMGYCNDVDIVVIEDFNDFISAIFRGKEVYININHKEERVKFIDVEKERKIEL